jgi:SAM-dependent methyltransferase
VSPASSRPAPDSRSGALPSPFDDAGLYDAIFHDFDLDLAFWKAEARAAQGPVLEVACGTGRVALPMAEAGADVDGFDLAPAMVERLRAKARERGLRVHAVPADMRDFRMPRRYALIAIPFNAFLHNLTQADQLATLACCRDHLQPGGKLVMHVSFFGPAISGATSGEPDLELETRHPVSGRRLQLYDSRTVDPVEQVQHSINEIRELNEHSEVVASHRSRTSVRWIYKHELELLLARAGFARWKIDGGFHGQPLTSPEDQMVASAWVERTP